MSYVRLFSFFITHDCRNLLDIFHVIYNCLTDHFPEENISLIFSGILFEKFLIGFLLKADKYGLVEQYTARTKTTISLFCRIITALSNIELDDLNVFSTDMSVSIITERMKDIGLVLGVNIQMIIFIITYTRMVNYSEKCILYSVHHVQ